MIAPAKRPPLSPTVEPVIPPHEKPIVFHSEYHREEGQPFGRCSYLVVVQDEALLALNHHHPLRYATIRFNRCAPPYKRVEALAEALRESAGDVADKSKPSFTGWLVRHREAVLSAAGFICGMLVGFLIA